MVLLFILFNSQFFLPQKRDYFKFLFSFQQYLRTVKQARHNDIWIKKMLNIKHFWGLFSIKLLQKTHWYDMYFDMLKRLCPKFTFWKSLAKFVCNFRTLSQQNPIIEFLVYRKILDIESKFSIHKKQATFILKKVEITCI